MVVNNVPRYEIKMIVDGRKPVAFGKGLALEELEDLSQVVNVHCALLRDQRDSGQSQRGHGGIMTFIP